MQHQSKHTTPALPEPLWRVLPDYLCDAVQRCRLPVEELRLYANRFAVLKSGGQTHPLGVILTDGQIGEILHAMCGGSLYAYADTIRQGYLTMDGGIRVGVCGSAAIEGARVIGVSAVTGLVIRLPHTVTVDIEPLTQRIYASGRPRGTLIFSPPGVGKTTILRALARDAASPARGRMQTVVIDTREELKYGLEGVDLTLHILSRYPRELGIEIAVRTLGAELILCDEIGSRADAEAILSAANSGVPLIASAHAASLEELLARPPLYTLHRAGVFDTYAQLLRTGCELDYRFFGRDTLIGGGA